ncbi:MAG: hypothetical protein HOF21_02975 [Nitrospina sp.]|jgi:hypothetical protein|nr:hypothetical protein [Nitrospina sp.]MBT5632985.1 hypothetical protein [Nitrospina sp.]
MDKILTITAISGWALPCKWFAGEVAAAFPGSLIKVVYPQTPENPEEAEILLRRNPADLYIGYSLGSLWLLKYRYLLPDTARKALLAPILSFLKKDGLGGTTSETQLKYLSRILKQNKDRQGALRDFFSYSNLPFPETLIEQMPDRETLLRGLEFLRSCRAKGEDTKIFLSILGENDIFIDGDLLKRHIPHLDIVQGVGHAPGKLLEHLAGRLNLSADNL